MKEKIVESLQTRLQVEVVAQNPLKILKQIKLEDIIDTAIPVIYLYTRGKSSEDSPVYMTELVCAIGHAIMSKEFLPKNSGLAAKIGAFILYSFEELNLLKVKIGAGKRRHQAYVVDVIDDKAILALWSKTPVEKTEKLPSEIPYSPWTSTTRKGGAKLIKTNNKKVLEEVTPETHPYVFSVVNKAQEIGWNVNIELYFVAIWAMQTKSDAFAEIWELRSNEARQSKIREAKSILSIADRFLTKTFYHLYYLDFRGRKYPTTAYFHEQGSDLAKGLLLRQNKKPITESGFKWLLVSLANNWGGDAGREDKRKTDKIPKNQRQAWALLNEEQFLEYAEKPKISQGWMKADKPWQFLAACIELKNLRVWQITNAKQISEGILSEYDYPSGLECFIDGSNNGSQHLAALTLDEITAPHVNLVPQEFPGDLYEYVAIPVWEYISEVVNKMPPSEVLDLEKYIDELNDLKNHIKDVPIKSELRRHLIEELLKKKKEKDPDKASMVFWNRVKDIKHRRKICKRNVMTLPYGGTPYGLGKFAQYKCL